jgi:hypothetical protein
MDQVMLLHELHGDPRGAERTEGWMNTAGEIQNFFANWSSVNGNLYDSTMKPKKRK